MGGYHIEDRCRRRWTSGWLSELVHGWIVDGEMVGCEMGGGPIMDKWVSEWMTDGGQMDGKVEKWLDE